MPRQIDGKPVHDAYKKLIKDEISEDAFFTIFNPFSNDNDRMIRSRGNNLGSVQRTLKELRDDLRTEIMPPLENDQTGLGLKILTLKQMFARLPILLAQIQVGNNSREFKNEIKQLLFCYIGQKR